MTRKRYSTSVLALCGLAIKYEALRSKANANVESDIGKLKNKMVMKPRHPCPTCKCPKPAKCAAISKTSTYVGMERRCDNVAKMGSNYCHMHQEKKK